MLLDRFLQSTIFFKLTNLLYLLSFILLVGSFLRSKSYLTSAALVIMLLAFGANTTLLVDSWMAAGRAPFKTLYHMS